MQDFPVNMHMSFKRIKIPFLFSVNRDSSNKRILSLNKRVANLLDSLLSVLALISVLHDILNQRDGRLKKKNSIKLRALKLKFFKEKAPYGREPSTHCHHLQLCAYVN